MSVEDEWSTIASILYFSFNLILLIIISCLTYNSNDSKSKWISKTWKKRGIYATILVHLYDTATDIGVIILWAQLAIKETTSDYNVDHVDMLIFFILGLIFVVLYRLCAFIMYLTADDERNCVAVLALLDLAIIYEVFQAHKDDEDEITPNILVSQIGEAVTESVPQVVLQSVFIIRTFTNDTNQLSTLEVLLIFFSIIASIMSISGKFIKLGLYSSAGKSDAANLTCNCEKHDQICCISIGYMIRSLWNIGRVLSRICIYVLFWSIIGGYFAVFYFIFELVLLFAIKLYLHGTDGIVFLAFVDAVAIVDDEHLPSGIYSIRIIDDIICMSLITFMSLMSSFDCGWCANPEVRSFNNNVAAMTFILVAWISIAIYIVLFMVGIKFEYIKPQN